MIKIKHALNFFFYRLRFYARRLINRCPRRLRILGGPILGGSIGLIGGIPGLLIGVLLGYLLGELFVQSRRDRKVFDYFENPGSQQFYEGEGGLAAWCALGVLIAAETSDALQSSEKIIKQVVLAACHVFTGFLADPSLMEHFSRLAFARRDDLNPDLLAESLLARSSLDKENLARGLIALAEGEKAKKLAREIRLILSPAMEDDYEPKDPWKILGLPQGTPLKEIKFHYRRLAKQFHPDNLQILDEKRQKTAAQAFMTIKEAYKQITGE